MIKETITYTTSDGVIFNDKEKALSYEDKLQNKEFVLEINGKPISHDDIVEYFKTNVIRGCDKCTFWKECHNMDSRVRLSTTNTFSLCDAINMVDIYG